MAAARSGRDAVGYDLDPAYVDIALARLAGDEAVPAGPASVSVADRMELVALALVGM